jgi:tripartite-type tricarboxylate transporter receptor subunit TctC
MSYTVPDDFTFLGSVALQPFALTVNAKLPIQSVEDLVAYAKKHPGKLNFASAGVGSVPHMGNVLINSSANIEMVHVPFSGLGPAVNAVIAGTVELGLATPSLMRPHVEAGTARVLAVTSESRFNGLPNIPTLKESGIDVIAVNSYGLIAPAGLQPSVVDRLLDVMKAIASDKALSDRLEKLGFTPVALIGDNYKDYITRDLEQWRSVAKRAGISIGK